MAPHVRPPSAPGCKPEPLRDPCKDRNMSAVDLPPPPAQTLAGDVFWGSDGMPDTDMLAAHFHLEGLVSHELLLEIVQKASDIFQQEPNLIKLQDPITVVGDIHGQYFDFGKLLEVGGLPGDTQYLFLGDYVDRGSFSVEVVLLLSCIKIKHSKRVRMLRGNHECRQMTAFFNFREECEYKYDISVYNAIMDMFDMLPLSATINGKFLAVHAGLSPDLPNVKAINNINRFQEPPREGLMCDLLWSDPYDKDGDEKKSSKKDPPFIYNEVRGCSYFFTFDGAAKFLQKNSLLSVIRAHEAQLEGYKMHKTNPATGFPLVITIFSAPNYCDVYNNKGAILKFDNSTLNILQFNCSPHPYHLPNFMDIFQWSMPFVIEKITEMLYYILLPDKDHPEDNVATEMPQLPDIVKTQHRKSLSVDQNKAIELAARLSNTKIGDPPSGDGHDSTSESETRDRIQKKVRSIGKMAAMFKTLREENETVIRLKGVCPGHKLKPGMLLAGKESMLNSEKELFNHATNIDADNDIRPDASGEVEKNQETDELKRSKSVPREFIEGSDDEDEGASATATAATITVK